MPKLTLTDLASSQNENTQITNINNNSSAIEAAIENTLSRDGTSPNSMSANIDMNSNRIINLPDPTSDAEPITRGYARDTYTSAAIGEAAVSADAAAASATAAAASATAAASSATDAATDAASVLTMIPVECTATYSNVSGYGTFALTATDVPASIADGDQVVFDVPTSLERTGGFKASLASPAVASSLIYAPDEVTLLSYDDIVQNQKLKLIYRTGPIWVQASNPLSTMQSVFGHGTCKLQVASSSTISLSQDDGRGILAWNTNANSFTPRMFGVITSSNLFAASNYVEGSASSALSNNQLYYVYYMDVAGTPTFNFCRCYTGAAAPTWTPVVNDIGIQVAPTTAGGSTPGTQVYLGTLWTAGGDVSTALSGSTITSRIISNFRKWRFPFYTTVYNLTGFATTTYTAQTAPRCEFVTDGITDTGQFFLFANYRNDTGNKDGYIKLVITGTDENGTAFSGESAECIATCPTAGYNVPMATSFGTALPRGAYTIEPSVKVTGGTGQFDLYMTGFISN